MKIDYFALALAIAVGVFLGQGAYGLTKLAWAEYELQQMSEWFEDDRARTQAQSIKSKRKREQEAAVRREKQQLERTQQLYAQRRKTKRGLGLKKDCLQWREQQRTMATDTVDQMVTQSCDRYETFILTGQVAK